ncbi:MAG: hypothetical protein JSV69_02385 [Chloroflexota bacterium]|nr:MAG: hypothetical protein JSV69_02385 [Chloroflexota bacterium]
MSNDPFGDLDVARQVVSITPHAELHELYIRHLPLFNKSEVTGRLIQDFLLSGIY